MNLRVKNGLLWVRKLLLIGILPFFGVKMLFAIGSGSLFAAGQVVGSAFAFFVIIGIPVFVLGVVFGKHRSGDRTD